MGRTLNRASLPRDAVGRVDLAAIDRSLATIAGSTPPRRAAPATTAVLVERLSSLGAPAAAAARSNGHPVAAPTMISPVAAVGRETRSPLSPGDAVAAKPTTPTDVRGVGRAGPEPAKPRDLQTKPPTAAARSPRPASDAPSVETSLEAAEVVVPEDVDLESLPPIEARGSAAPPTPPPPASPAAEFGRPSGGVVPRPSINPLAGVPPRPSYGSIPVVAPLRPAPAVDAREVAAVGAVFDEFLGSAPVEPAPRPPPGVPRAAPAIPAGLPRRPSMQVPAFRPAPTAVGAAPGVPRVAPARVPDIEVVEPVEVEEMEVEEMEVVAPAVSKAPPPLPPRKR